MSKVTFCTGIQLDDEEVSNAEIIETVQLWWDTIKNDTWVDYDMRQKHEKVLERLKELLK